MEIRLYSNHTHSYSLIGLMKMMTNDDIFPPECRGILRIQGGSGTTDDEQAAQTASKRHKSVSKGL